jgi:hypothetical protein
MSFATPSRACAREGVFGLHKKGVFGQPAYCYRQKKRRLKTTSRLLTVKMVADTKLGFPGFFHSIKKGKEIADFDKRLTEIENQLVAYTK